MFNLPINGKIYICTGHTDMRKGISSLVAMSSNLLSGSSAGGVVILYRGKIAHKLKILWWDGQGYCLYNKWLESGIFPWLNGDDEGYISIDELQLLMLLEGGEWRTPRLSAAPEYGS